MTNETPELNLDHDEIFVHTPDGDRVHLTTDPEDRDKLRDLTLSYHERRDGTPYVDTEIPAQVARDTDERLGSSRLLSRFLMGVHPGDGRRVVHMNGDPLDFRRENLRIRPLKKAPVIRRTAKADEQVVPAAKLPTPSA